MNVGYSPQTRADSTAIAKSFAWQARVEFPKITPVFTVDGVVEIQESGGIALAFDLEDSNPLEETWPMSRTSTTSESARCCRRITT